MVVVLLLDLCEGMVDLCWAIGKSDFFPSTPPPPPSPIVVIVPDVLSVYYGGAAERRHNLESPLVVSYYL